MKLTFRGWLWKGIKQIPIYLKDFYNYIKSFIISPEIEIAIGLVGEIIFLVIGVFDILFSIFLNLHSMFPWWFILFAVPLFFLLLHGIYRDKR